MKHVWHGNVHIMIDASEFQYHYQLTVAGDIAVTASGDPRSPVLSRFFAGYDQAFILPDEREELDGFERCLALNATHRHIFGRTHCELVAVLEDENGALLGGANFLATAIGRGSALPCATVALNYVYVTEAVRGQGLLRKALTAVRQLAPLSLGLHVAGGSTAIFIEQNDPLRLSAEDYAADTAHSGLDQLDRLAIWARMGARVVDFDYVQPPLSADQQLEDTLIYAAVDYPGCTVDAGLLHDHLESFFAISVLKGGNEPPGGPARRQVAALAARSAPVRLLDMDPALAYLRNACGSVGFNSFRELAASKGG